MKNNIRKIWIDSLDLILKRPVLLLPFIVYAFLEGLALELVYFSSHKPISIVTNPIIKKFFGERFIHYPGNLLLLPKLFYFAQVVIYIAAGVFLTAVSVNIFKNLKAKLPVRPLAFARNLRKRYSAFFAYGVLLMALLYFLNKLDMFILASFFKFTSKEFPNATVRVAPFVTPVFLFITNVIMQAFLLLALPIIVIQNKSFTKALIASIYLGVRNFFGLFTLICAPYLLYFPISLLKSFSGRLVSLTFPEINVVIAGAGIILSALISCFVIISASQLLLNITKTKTPPNGVAGYTS